MSSMVRLPWTTEEDEYLIKAVQKWGVKNWAQVVQGLPGRTSKAASHRYRTYLMPGVRQTSTEPFTEWEIAVLQEAHKRVGNDWQAIAKMLPGRTNAAVKNFWYAYTRRRMRADLKAKGMSPVPKLTGIKRTAGDINGVAAAASADAGARKISLRKTVSMEHLLAVPLKHHQCAGHSTGNDSPCGAHSTALLPGSGPNSAGGSCSPTMPQPLAVGGVLLEAGVHSPNCTSSSQNSSWAGSMLLAPAQHSFFGATADGCQPGLQHHDFMSSAAGCVVGDSEVQGMAGGVLLSRPTQQQQGSQFAATAAAVALSAVPEAEDELLLAAWDCHEAHFAGSTALGPQHGQSQHTSTGEMSHSMAPVVAQYHSSMPGTLCSTPGSQQHHQEADHAGVPVQVRSSQHLHGDNGLGSTRSSFTKSALEASQAYHRQQELRLACGTRQGGMSLKP